jgi:hypothetical protein
VPREACNRPERIQDRRTRQVDRRCTRLQQTVGGTCHPNGGTSCLHTFHLWSPMCKVPMTADHQIIVRRVADWPWCLPPSMCSDCMFFLHQLSYASGCCGTFPAANCQVVSPPLTSQTRCRCLTTTKPRLTNPTNQMKAGWHATILGSNSSERGATGTGRVGEGIGRKQSHA